MRTWMMAGVAALTLVGMADVASAAHGRLIRSGWSARRTTSPTSSGPAPSSSSRRSPPIRAKPTATRRSSGWRRASSRRRLRQRDPDARAARAPVPGEPLGASRPLASRPDRAASEPRSRAVGSWRPPRRRPLQRRGPPRPRSRGSGAAPGAPPPAAAAAAAGDARAHGAAGARRRRHAPAAARAAGDAEPAVRRADGSRPGPPVPPGVPAAWPRAAARPPAAPGAPALVPGVEYFPADALSARHRSRIEALNGLLEGHSERVIPLLREIALDGNNPDEARRAVLVLARSHRPEARTTVVEVARRGPEPVRLAAIREMGRFDGATVTAELMQVYRCPRRRASSGRSSRRSATGPTTSRCCDRQG